MITREDLLELEPGDYLVTNGFSYLVVDTDHNASLPTAVIEQGGQRLTICVNADREVVDLEHGKKIIPLCDTRATIQKQPLRH